MEENKPVEYKERGIKRMPISIELLANLGSGKFEVIANPLPPDAKAFHADYNEKEKVVNLFISSEEFSPVVDDSPIETVEPPTIKRLEESAEHSTFNDSLMISEVGIPIPNTSTQIYDLAFYTKEAAEEALQYVRKAGYETYKFYPDSYVGHVKAYLATNQEAFVIAGFKRSQTVFFSKDEFIKALNLPESLVKEVFNANLGAY